MRAGAVTALPLQTKHASDSIMFPLTGLSDSEIKLKLLTRKWRAAPLRVPSAHIHG